MLSIPTDRPVDPLTITVLSEIDRVAKRLQVPYFVCGATARDILLFHVFGFEIDRATADIDTAVAVEHWSEFAEVKRELIETKAFTAGKAPQRLFHSAPGGREPYPLDVIPFGELDQGTGTVFWPEEPETKLNVAGCQDALATAVQIDIAPGLTVPFVSLVGLTILKLFAWADRGSVNTRDALDLAKILRCYADAGNQRRLYEDYLDVLESTEYDLTLAGAQLLGIDVRRGARPETIEALTTLLESNANRDRLAQHMVPALRMKEDPLEEAESLLNQFISGLLKASA